MGKSETPNIRNFKNITCVFTSANINIWLDNYLTYNLYNPRYDDQCHALVYDICAYDDVIKIKYKANITDNLSFSETILLQSKITGYEQEFYAEKLVTCKHMYLHVCIDFLLLCDVSNVN